MTDALLPPYTLMTSSVCALKMSSRANASGGSSPPAIGASQIAHLEKRLPRPLSIRSSWARASSSGRESRWATSTGMARLTTCQPNCVPTCLATTLAPAPKLEAMLMTAIGPPSSVEMADDMLSADEWDQVRGLWTEALAAMLPA
jgi:hypothetical protein